MSAVTCGWCRAVVPQESAVRLVNGWRCHHCRDAAYTCSSCGRYVLPGSGGLLFDKKDLGKTVCPECWGPIAQEEV